MQKNCNMFQKIVSTMTLFNLGFCCIEYTVCSDLNSWSLFTMSDGMGGMETPLIESSCTTDWVEIEGSNEMCALNRVNNRYCGHVLADTPTADPILSTKICGKIFSLKCHLDLFWLVSLQIAHNPSLLELKLTPPCIRIQLMPPWWLLIWEDWFQKEEYA